MVENKTTPGEDAEMLTVGSVGCLGALAGVGIAATIYVLLGTQPVLRNLPWHGWLALGGALATTLGPLAAQRAKRSLDQKRQIWPLMGQLLREVDKGLDETAQDESKRSAVEKARAELELHIESFPPAVRAYLRHEMKNKP